MGRIRYEFCRAQKPLAVFLLALTCCGMNRGFAQDKPESSCATESAAEAYKAAMAPFEATRSQQDDLTESDKVALGIGMAKAAQDCQALSSKPSSSSQSAEELLALGRLCMFGQQFEQARVALVAYLSLPQPPQRERALLMLTHAFLGLDSPGSAEDQIQSLLIDYPYDASIHLAIDAVVDNAEATGIDQIVSQLCQMQTAATLPILKSVKALESKEATVSAAALFNDAMRCAAFVRASGRSVGLDPLVSIAQQQNWVGTADFPVIQASLQRQQMVGKPSPLPIVHGHLVSSATLVPRTISFAHGTALLVPFTLWSPSTPSILENFARAAPHWPIYAITSW